MLSVQGAETRRYSGFTGRVKAVFDLTWNDDGTVEGTYSCPGRSTKVYALRGDNNSAGKLRLDEFTDGSLSARVMLEKEATAQGITWEGWMHNVDGRKINVSFQRMEEPAGQTPAQTSKDGVDVDPWDVGKLYFGYVLEGEGKALPITIESQGTPAAFAVIFSGKAVLIGYETVQGHRGSIKGINVSEGVIIGELQGETGAAVPVRLDRGSGSIKQFSKETQAVSWSGGGQRLSLLFPGPTGQKEFGGPTDFLNEDYKIAPESAKWLYTNGTERPQFYKERLTGIYGQLSEVDAKVSSAARVNQKIVIGFQSSQGPLVLEIPDRSSHRIPVVVGAEVTLHVTHNGRIPFITHQCGSEYLRKLKDGRFEYGLVSLPKGFFQNPTPAAAVQLLPKLIVLPDFCPYGDTKMPGLQWWTYEDKISWNYDAAGPGELELEASIPVHVEMKNLSTETITPGREGWERADKNVWQLDRWVDDLNSHSDQAREIYQRRYPIQVRIWSAG